MTALRVSETGRTCYLCHPSMRPRGISLRNPVCSRTDTGKRGRTVGRVSMGRLSRFAWRTFSLSLSENNGR